MISRSVLERALSAMEWCAAQPEATPEGKRKAEADMGEVRAALRMTILAPDQRAACEAGAAHIRYFTDRATMVSAEQSDAVARLAQHAAVLKQLATRGY